MNKYIIQTIIEELLRNILIYNKLYIVFCRYCLCGFTNEQCVRACVYIA